LSVGLAPKLCRRHTDIPNKRVREVALIVEANNPQTVLFAGYSSTRPGTDRRDILEQSRTFFLKIGYAWLV
jgi:hypothetical protein